MRRSPTAITIMAILSLLLQSCTSTRQSPPEGIATLQEAYDALLNSYVEPLDPTILALGATTGMVGSLARQGVTVPPADVPAFGGGNRDQIWTALEQSYTVLARRYAKQVSPQTLAYDAVRQMATSVNDCHTEFSSPKELQDEEANLRGTTRFGGIGAFLLDRPGDPPAIREVFQDGPADKAGVVAGDVIRQVDGKDVTNLHAHDVAGLIRGQEGTSVELTLDRGVSTQKKVSIVRQQVSPPILNTSLFTARTGKIAYLHLYSFPSILGSRIDKVLTDLQKQGAKGWIIDLRENGGGQLDAMQAFASKFLHRGPFDLLVDRHGKQTLLQPNGTVLQGIQPIAVIVNEDSASASEMFAAAVQEQHAGAVVGTRTRGCIGVAQQMTLHDGSGLQIKVEKVLGGVTGTPLDGNGVTPDIVVGLTPADLSNGNDPQLEAAARYVAAQLAK